MMKQCSRGASWGKLFLDLLKGRISSQNVPCSGVVPLGPRPYQFSEMCSFLQFKKLKIKKKKIYSVPFRFHPLNQGGPNPGPRATCGPRQHFLWPAENSAKNSGETARKSLWKMITSKPQTYNVQSHLLLVRNVMNLFWLKGVESK